MRIEFYDAAGCKIRAEVVETDDYWDACTYGLSQLSVYAIDGAEEYQVFEDYASED